VPVEGKRGESRLRVAVGTKIAPRPRTNPGVRCQRTGLLPQANVGRQKPLTLRRTAANRIDVATRLSVRTTAACRLFPSGEALPSTISAGSCLPFFDRFLGTTTSSDFSPTYMLDVRLCLPEPPGTGPGAGETCRVGEGVATPAPHSSGRARFAHPVPHVRASSHRV
jgi:hypothetical protein